MEIKYWFLIAGVLIGWTTKVPFLIKWYNELKQYKVKKTELYNRLVNMILELPKDEQSKHWIGVNYFKDTP